ncbi:2-acylglycerol O-acyltransferase 2-like isoform X2 [Ornithodoros turicata]
MKILGIEFAPLFLPVARRLQTAAVIYTTAGFMLGGLLCTLLCVYLLFFTQYYFVPLIYLAWYIVDRETPKRGGRASDWVRRWKLWKYERDYFPIELVKTAELDSNKNYIMGYHPHGITAFGAQCNFATEATDFSKVFPGIKPHPLTLNLNFKFPFTRELLMFYGMCSVDRESLVWILTKQGTGNAAIIVIGGAQEALYAHKGSYVLELKKRKGFARYALKCGADLVPVFSFGENDIFSQVKNPPGSILRRFQESCKRLTTVSPVVFYGRGIFQYNYGYLPYRSRIVTVVGKPISVAKVEEPTQEQVDSLHRKYVDQLKELFEEHKTRYGAANCALEII